MTALAVRLAVAALTAASAFAAGTGVASATGGQERVVFMGGGNDDIYSSNYDGSDLTQVTDCATTGCNVYWPVLSPGGQTIAAESGRPSISLYSLDGRHQRVLTTDHASFPAWAPDGKSVLYTRDSTEPDGSTHEELYSVSTLNSAPSDGSDATPVITGPGDHEEGDYSADGQRIVYDGNTAPGDPYGLWIANADGTDRHELDLSAAQISGGRFFDAHFSPDGSRVAFVWQPPTGPPSRAYSS